MAAAHDGLESLHMTAIFAHVAMERVVAAVLAEIILPCIIVDLQHVLAKVSLLPLENFIATGEPQIGCSGGVRSGQAMAG